MAVLFPCLLLAFSLSVSLLLCLCPPLAVLVPPQLSAASAFSISSLASSLSVFLTCIPLPVLSLFFLLLFVTTPQITSNQSILPSASCAFANTPKYSQVLGLGGRIVRKEWVLDCHRMRRRLPSRR